MVNGEMIKYLKGKEKYLMKKIGFMKVNMIIINLMEIEK